MPILRREWTQCCLSAVTYSGVMLRGMSLAEDTWIIGRTGNGTFGFKEPSLSE